MPRHARGQTRVHGAQQNAFVRLIARESGEQCVGKQRLLSALFALGVEHGEIDGRKQRVREDAIINLEERAPVQIVAPEDVLALAPEMLFKILSRDAVIDDAIGRQTRRHERRLDAVLQIS